MEVEEICEWDKSFNVKEDPKPTDSGSYTNYTSIYFKATRPVDKKTLSSSSNNLKPPTATRGGKTRGSRGGSRGGRGVRGGRGANLIARGRGRGGDRGRGSARGGVRGKSARGTAVRGRGRGARGRGVRGRGEGERDGRVNGHRRSNS